MDTTRYNKTDETACFHQFTSFIKKTSHNKEVILHNNVQHA
jgi:hypothetical protein